MIPDIVPEPYKTYGEWKLLDMDWPLVNGTRKILAYRGTCFADLSSPLVHKNFDDDTQKEEAERLVLSKIDEIEAIGFDAFMKSKGWSFGISYSGT